MGRRRRGQVSNNAATNAKPAQKQQKQQHPPPPPATPSSLPTELQQSILNVFRHAFPLANQHDLSPTIQQVKGHLYNRDFASAFSKPAYLAAYALRWSAARALCYADIFSQQLDLMHVHVRPPENVPDQPSRPPASTQAHAHAYAGPPPPPTLQVQQSASKVVCIGGGAGAEIVAFAACALSRTSPTPTPTPTRIDITAVDIADWSHPISALQSALANPPPLSAYASDAARQANKSLITPDLTRVVFLQRDILAVPEGSLRDLMQGVTLCTLMFTLNELFSSSIAQTTAFLLSLTDVMGAGASLVVVDSPGSYSEIRLGRAEEQEVKKYPMKWLLDHALLDVGKGRWRKEVDDDSRWFRVEKGLDYPVELENMRYQIHVYRRL